MTDDVLAVRYSPNGKLLAVALLDSTVKVFDLGFGFRIVIHPLRSRHSAKG